MNNDENSHQNARHARQAVLRPPVDGEELPTLNYSKNKTEFVKMKNLNEELYFITDGYSFIFLMQFSKNRLQFQTTLMMFLITQAAAC